MKFARLGSEGQERPVVIVDDQAYSVSGLVDDIDAGFWMSGAPERIARALDAGELPVVEDADRLRIGAPVARPGAVVCVGLNYAAHAAESGVRPPSAPVIFLKVPNTVVGPNDVVTIPKNTRATSCTRFGKS